LLRGSFLSLVELLQKHAEREGKHKAPMKTMKNMRLLMDNSMPLSGPSVSHPPGILLDLP